MKGATLAVTTGTRTVRGVGRFVRRTIFVVTLCMFCFMLGAISGNDLVKWGVKHFISTEQPTTTQDDGWHIPFVGN